MTLKLIKNARIVDGSIAEPTEPLNILIENDRICEVSADATSPDAEVMDVRGKTVMPGLIDCHVHVIATTTNLGKNADLPNSLVALRSAKIMERMLMRGFTTVRDLGGADYGLVEAVEQDGLPAPRLVICGKALSQTGGHTDYRGRHSLRSVDYYRDQIGSLGVVVNGVDEVRRAAREQIKGGADFIKVMANGGVSSPTDPIAILAFSTEELKAAVEEAKNAQLYVSGHLYTDEAIRRALECGIESIEHANLMKPETAKLIREAGAVVIPTNITYDLLAREGARFGLPEESVAKIEDVRGAGLECLTHLHKAGVVMGYGSDLLGEMHDHQSEEFLLRGRYLPAKDVIRSATIDAAKVLRKEGEIGVIAPGAFADIIVVDGNPLDDLSLLTRQGVHMPLIMKGGRIFKNTGSL
ncbi:amidohydrolase family protein [Thalassospira sp. MCCC 1A03138]|uniref:metal-dependent hydrolase family protein n=1 Tax=Thalassospira sp. MCCC 1A03138 TaxID=1470576 RepID=UPI000A1E2626|nr:amidohydrolase family protein [Thalassospira sp. MCCC 1A03138]OSQ27201.1 peptidase M38 [Thalassospira sp. MCCC 1A03138]